jgi:hypothetical protein
LTATLIMYITQRAAKQHVHRYYAYEVLNCTPLAYMAKFSEPRTQLVAQEHVRAGGV